MSVEKVGQEQAQYLAQKKRELEEEESRLVMDKARVARDRARAMKAEQEKSEDAIVKISKEADQQVSGIRQINSSRINQLNDDSRKFYENLAQQTAEQFKKIDEDSLQKLNAHRSSSLEKLKVTADRAEDPFYRMKSFNPVISESEKEFTVKISLPEHEAKNLFVSGDNKNLKISLARRFADALENQETGAQTKTSNYQTILESVSMPGAFDSRTIKKDYADGLVTIRVARV